MNEILLVLQFVLAIAITIVVLLQKSSSIGLGVYSGSNESLFGAKGPASFLAKITFVLGVLFVVNTIALGYVYSKYAQRSVFDHVNKETLVPSASPILEQNSTILAPKADEKIRPKDVSSSVVPDNFNDSKGDNHVAQ